jgi:hypothetical protein
MRKNHLDHGNRKKPCIIESTQLPGSCGDQQFAAVVSHPGPAGITKGALPMALLPLSKPGGHRGRKGWK